LKRMTVTQTEFHTHYILWIFRRWWWKLESKP
jgi:hypothetical protein